MHGAFLLGAGGLPPDRPVSGRSCLSCLPEGASPSPRGRPFGLTWFPGWPGSPPGSALTQNDFPPAMRGAGGFLSGRRPDSPSGGAEGGGINARAHALFFFYLKNLREPHNFLKYKDFLDRSVSPQPPIEANRWLGRHRSASPPRIGVSPDTYSFFPFRAASSFSTRCLT